MGACIAHGCLHLTEVYWALGPTAMAAALNNVGKDGPASCEKDSKRDAQLKGVVKGLEHS